MIKGMQWKILFEILILVILLVVIGSFWFFKFQGQYISDFQNKTELKTVCKMWNCEEPIPSRLISECSTISECKSYCKNLGARMLKCK